MIEQVILVALFIGLLAFGALACSMLLCALIQIVCYGFDFMSQKCYEMVLDINDKLNKGEDK